MAVNPKKLKKINVNNFDLVKIQANVEEVLTNYQQQIDSKLDQLISGLNIKTINGNSVLGSGNLVVTASGSTSWGGIIGTLSAQTDLQSALNSKQNTLVSGTNIKTINSNSLLGSGNISISASAAWGGITGTLSAQTDLQTALNNKLTDPMTTNGDLITRSGGSPVRLAIGTAGQFLTVAAGLPSWSTLSIVNTDINASAAIALSKLASLTADRAVQTSSGGVLEPSSVTSTELSYVSGVTSAIQTQLNAKEPTVTKGNLTETTSSVLTITGGTNAVIGSGASIEVSQASGSTSGYLSSTDWNTFNNKQASLGFTPENVSNKSVNLTSPDNTKYPTTLAVSTALSGKQDTLGFTPQEDVITTRGDVVVGNSSGDASRLALGTNGQVLTSNGTDAVWASPSAPSEVLVSLSNSTTVGSIDTTPVACAFDTTEYTSGTGDFTISSGAVTVVNAGTYEISYDCSVDEASGNNRTEFASALFLNGSELGGTRGFMYSRLNAQGANSASCRIVKTLSASDVIDMRAARLSGPSTGEFIANGSRLFIRKITT